MNTPFFFQRFSRLGFQLPTLPPEAWENRFPGGALKLDGQLVAQLLQEQCKGLAKGRSLPRLVVILVGNHPASQSYVKKKMKSFEECGFPSDTLRFSEEVTQKELLDTIAALNADPSVHGFLVQLPLPPHLDPAALLAAIDPRKDVDGFLPTNMGHLALGEWGHHIPCTPLGVMVLLATYRIETQGKRAVVLGRSNIVGKPLSLLLLAADATVTTVHSRTADLETHTRSADIVIAAIGKRQFVTPQHIKPGATLIDVGMNLRDNGKLCGDVADETASVAGALTPVPRGVGPMTVAMLLMATCASAWENP